MRGELKMFIGVALFVFTLGCIAGAILEAGRHTWPQDVPTGDVYYSPSLVDRTVP